MRPHDFAAPVDPMDNADNQFCSRRSRNIKTSTHWLKTVNTTDCTLEIAQEISWKESLICGEIPDPPRVRNAQAAPTIHSQENANSVTNARTI